MLINSTQPDVPPGKFVEIFKETRTKIVVMSGFLTLAYDPIKGIAADLKHAIWDVKIMIGT